MRFGASWPFDHARPEALLSVPFWCTFLALVRLWTTVFFFQLDWKTHSMFGDMLVECWHWKSPDLSDFHPCRSSQSLAIAPGQSPCPEFRKGDIQEEQSIPRSRKNASLVNKEPEWSDERLSSKKKKKERKEKKARVPWEWSSRQAACIGGWAMYRQTNTPFTEPTQESNSCSSYYFFHSSRGLFQKKKKKKKKKNGCWACGGQEGLSWSQPGDALDQHPYSELSPSRNRRWARRERFRSYQWASFLAFSCNVRFFDGNSESAYGALWKSIDCHWALRRVYPPVAQLSFEKKKKKKEPLANQKNPRAVSLEEKDSCRNMRQEN